MKILTVDVGTGTQDIFLYDSNLDIENGFKLILPSPTMMVYRKIQSATTRQTAICLTGGIMGGGPSSWAVEAHLRAGLKVFATPQAAQTINDDLEAVKQLGVTIVSDDEAGRLPDSVEKVKFSDFDFPAIEAVFNRFGVSLNKLAAVAVAVFDHGDAPPEISDRAFRFEYLDQIIRTHNSLRAFAFPANEIPPIMTRLQSVVDSAGQLPAPLIVMDTAPAAVLGATFDPKVAARPRQLIANVGNFHTIAFRLGPGGIEGVFEHHTGLLDAEKLDQLLIALAAGSLTNEEVFGHHGHGALIYGQEPLALDNEEFNLVLTGPRRNLLINSKLKTYNAVPFGDMMIAGCFGLLASVSHVLPEFAQTIDNSLKGLGGSGTPPWEIEENN
ncbi:MAG: DUF1786 domain-containing protein [Anaerolineaceae bacterium]|nr:DUF1786 domain-containing protein [Anaerolineaceae bacterium]